MSGQRTLVLYDGQCPFCASYVRMARLREAGEVELVDARTAPAAVALYTAAGYPLDEGMIVDMGGTVFHGWEAVWAINALTTGNPVLRRLSRKGLLRAVYPALRAGRNLTLRILGRRPIGTGSGTGEAAGS